MPRLSLAIAAVIALSVIPPVPPAVSAPISIGASMGNSNGSLLVDVSHRRKYCHRDVRRHYHRALRRTAWHRHVGPNCRPRIVRRHHNRHDGGCFRIGDIRICF